MGDVPHPLRAYLENLKSDVQRIQSVIGGKMDKPTNAMGSREVWVGPTARTWGDALSQKRKDYNNALNALEDEIVTKYRSTPEKCSEAEAKQWRMRLYGGGGYF